MTIASFQIILLFISRGLCTATSLKHIKSSACPQPKGYLRQRKWNTQAKAEKCTTGCRFRDFDVRLRKRRYIINIVVVVIVIIIISRIVIVVIVDVVTGIIIVIEIVFLLVLLLLLLV